MELLLLELENTPKEARKNAEEQQKIQKQIDRIKLLIENFVTSFKKSKMSAPCVRHLQFLSFWASELKLNHVSFYMSYLNNILPFETN